MVVELNVGKNRDTLDKLEMEAECLRSLSEAEGQVPVSSMMGLGNCMNFRITGVLQDICIRVVGQEEKLRIIQAPDHKDLYVLS